MVPSITTRLGRKGIPVKIHNLIATIALTGGTPKDAIAESGVSQTKVYEIFRNPVIKPDPEAQH